MPIADPILNVNNTSVNTNPSSMILLCVYDLTIGYRDPYVYGCEQNCYNYLHLREVESF